MKIFIVIALLTLTGCGINVSNHREIEWAKDVCANNDGLKMIRVYPMSLLSATCHNGARFEQSKEAWLKYSQENNHALN